MSNYNKNDINPNPNIKLFFLVLIIIAVFSNYLIHAKNILIINSVIALLMILCFFEDKNILISLFISSSFFDFNVEGLTYFKILGYIIVIVLSVNLLTKQIILKNNYNKYLMIIFVCLLSQIVNREFNSFYIIKLVMILVMMVSIESFVKTLRELYTVILLLGFAGVCAAIFTINEIVSHPDIKRVTGSMGNPNNTAAIFVMIFPFSLMYYKKSKKTILKVLSILFGIIIITGILVCASRGAFASLFIVYLIMIFSTSWKVKFPIILITILTLIIVKNSFDYYRGFERYQKISDEGLLSSKSTKIRIEVTKIGLNVFLKNPIFGVGSGRFQEKTVGPKNRYLGYLGGGIAPHNMYSQILAELGLIGAIVFFIYFYDIVKRLYINSKNESNDISMVSNVLLLSFLSLLITMASSGNYIKPYLYVIASFTSLLDKFSIDS